MADSTPILALPYILPSQAQKHVTHNEALDRLDPIVQASVTARTLPAPPAAPAQGARYIVAPGGQYDWAGQDNRIAHLPDSTQGWQFTEPQPGWRVFVLAEAAECVWTGSEWAELIGLEPEFTMLGISAQADLTNRLAVASDAVLLSHAGAGIQLKLNKAQATDTGSLLFQHNWSGRAEMGLAGSDDFSIKVSADGSLFRTAVTVARATGVVSLPLGATVGGSLGGTAVQQTATDMTAGRLLTVGAFGLGAPAPVVGDIGVTSGSLAPGFHLYDTGAGSTGGPAGVSQAILLHQRRSASGGEVQILWVEAGTPAPGAVFSRARSAGGWSTWCSAGTVLNATTAQGRYRRDQDGTQTCWQRVTTLTTGELAVSFPAAFATTADLVTVIGVDSTTAAAIMPRYTGRSVTGLNVSAFNSGNARVAATLDIVTTGRWI